MAQRAVSRKYPVSKSGMAQCRRLARRRNVVHSTLEGRVFPHRGSTTNGMLVLFCEFVSVVAGDRAMHCLKCQCRNS